MPRNRFTALEGGKTRGVVRQCQEHRDPPFVERLVSELEPISVVARARAFCARAIRAAGLLARDPRIPRPLRWLAAFGLLPIPGPVDEVVLLIVAPLMFAFHREAMREAWERAAG